ncbi:MAG TPA: hypothetical protein VI636_12030 [Candidatus Angelobacter sp.]
MDSYTPQGGSQVTAGHEESDINLRGIILFLVVLVISGGLTFLAASGLLRVFEWGEKTYFDKKPTPAQQVLHEERGDLARKETIKPPPDWYDREIDAKVLARTFATPRLQEDDAGDMSFFLKVEEERLGSAGKDPDGSVHIPIDRAIDLLSDPNRGLPQVNGTFVPGPPLGNLTDVSEAAQRRLNQANAQGQTKNDLKK